MSCAGLVKGFTLLWCSNGKKLNALKIRYDHICVTAVFVFQFCKCLLLAFLQLSHSVEMGELKKDLAVARVKVVACYHFVTFLPLILFFIFYCFVLLTSVQAKYERDLEIVVKEKETERDIEMKKVSHLPLILYLTHMTTPTPIHIR